MLESRLFAALACALLAACGSDDGGEAPPSGTGGAVATGGAPSTGGAAVATGGSLATGGAAHVQEWFCRMNPADATVCSCIQFQPGGFNLAACPPAACSMFDGTTCASFSVLPAGAASCEEFAALSPGNRVVRSCPPP